MRSRIAALPSIAEFAIVVGLTYGLHLVLFTIGVARSGFQPSIHFTNARVIGLLGFEILTAAILGFFLYLRGWQRDSFNLRFSLSGTGIGVLLWIGVYLLYIISFIIVGVIFKQGDNIRAISFHGNLSVTVSILLVLINPLFEEFLHLGYVIKAVESHGASFAIATSTLLRLLVHIYQGPVVVISILPMGLLFSIYYWRYRRLWPPVFAHIIGDLLAVISLSYRHGT